MGQMSKVEKQVREGQLSGTLRLGFLKEAEREKGCVARGALLKETEYLVPNTTKVGLEERPQRRQLACQLMSFLAEGMLNDEVLVVEVGAILGCYQ